MLSFCLLSNSLAYGEAVREVVCPIVQQGYTCVVTRTQHVYTSHVEAASRAKWRHRKQEAGQPDSSIGNSLKSCIILPKFYGALVILKHNTLFFHLLGNTTKVTNVFVWRVSGDG